MVLNAVDAQKNKDTYNHYMSKPDAEKYGIGVRGEKFVPYTLNNSENKFGVVLENLVTRIQYFASWLLGKISFGFLGIQTNQEAIDETILRSCDVLRAENGKTEKKQPPKGEVTDLD